jgi:peptidoglycan/LPS O-acetylase OafA/YrhL
MQTMRLKPLDSLRGIAAIGVAFFWHYQHFIPQDQSPFRHVAHWFYYYGWNLVDFFFVLSGFVFSYIYLQKILERKITLSEFSILRLSRLYPLHLVTLLVVIIIFVVRSLTFNDFFNIPYNNVYYFLLNILFVHGIGFEHGFSFNAPSWSVSTEIVAYLLFFLILFKFNKKYFVCFVCLIFIGLSIHDTKLQYPIFNENIARVLIGFFMGCVTYKFNIFINNTKNKGIWMTFLVFVLSLVTFLGIMFGSKVFGDWPIVYVVLIYPLIVIISLNISILNKIMSIKPLVYLGEISYSVYLWHFPVQILINSIDDTFLLHINFSSRIVFIGIVIFTLLISAISYEFFEKPAQKYLRNKYLAKLQLNRLSSTPVSQKANIQA